MAVPGVPDKLRVIPLGGLGEIGRNMLVLEYRGHLLIIDAGVMFPNNDMYGVDVILPDMAYVVERAEQVLGIIITHGHEDHIGALPYLLAHLHVPVYATALTRGFIEVKLREAQVHDADLRTIQPRGAVALGPFGIEFFHMSHSIPDGVGLAIRTPLGLVVHSGDFKFDHNPVNGQPSDFARLAAFGDQDVLLLLSDSTNAESSGYTPSEQAMEENLRTVFAQAQGRILVATFASNISRVQQVVDISSAYNRRVAVVGKSMVSNIKIARELGYLTIDPGTLLNLNQIGNMPAHEITLICTGSQGEPASALVRMGNGDYRSVQVQAGDTIIVSAAPIPGNEESINRNLDNLFRLGAAVFYDEVFNVHVSGHASQEELKLLLNLVRPKHFIPIHGEYRHLVWHGRLAANSGLVPGNIHVIESGDVLEIDANSAQVVDHISSDYIYMNANGENADHQVVEERRLLANNGIVVVCVNVDRYTGGLVGLPQIESRGLLPADDKSNHYAALQAQIAAVVERGGSRSELTKRLEAVTSRTASQILGRRPLVVAVLSKV